MQEKTFTHFTFLWHAESILPKLVSFLLTAAHHRCQEGNKTVQQGGRTLRHFQVLDILPFHLQREGADRKNGLVNLNYGLHRLAL